MSDVRLRVLSLGAGVQSTTLALMAAKGVVGPMPDAAIFADTQWEPKAVYEHLERLKPLLPYPVHVVSAGSIRDSIISKRTAGSGRYASIPWFIKTVIPAGSRVLDTSRMDGPDSEEHYRVLATDQIKLGMGRRQCTAEFKIKPIMHKVRDLLGVTRRGRIPAGVVEQWVGISTDEAGRMKAAKQKYVTTRWPLIENNLSRTDCQTWLQENYGMTAPKSACIGCPFHNQTTWQRMRDQQPAEFEEACRIDEVLRQGDARGMRGVEYMHPARIPLRQAVEIPAKRKETNHFVNECEGMCGN